MRSSIVQHEHPATPDRLPDVVRERARRDQVPQREADKGGVNRVRRALEHGPLRRRGAERRRAPRHAHALHARGRRFDDQSAQAVKKEPRIVCFFEYGEKQGSLV